MLRQRTGSTVCPGCGSLVGVNDEVCYSCGRRNPALWGFAPLFRRLGQDLGFAKIVMAGSIGLYLATLVASHDPLGGGGGIFSILGPDNLAVFMFGASGATPVFGYGRWWTVLSATWLHGGLLHILFNMMAVRNLAPAMADLYGPGRMVIIYVVGGATGFALSSVGNLLLRGGGLTLGASAALFAWLGALVYYGRRTGSSIVREQAWRYAAYGFVYGFLLPGIDNFAHAGGFAGGWLVAMVLDPMTRERVDHLILGVACLALSAAAVIASLIVGLPH
jgi:rhomboid protease GluP